jgi:excinuclease ABC subunit C
MRKTSAVTRPASPAASGVGAADEAGEGAPVGDAVDEAGASEAGVSMIPAPYSGDPEAAPSSPRLFSFEGRSRSREGREPREKRFRLPPLKGSPLRAKVREKAGRGPGVYRFLCQGEPVYIGRSRSLRTRLLSYFRAADGTKSSIIVRAADDLEWEETPSEFECHLTELRLIKQIRPRLNRMLKDDRDYVFIRFGSGPAPRMSLTRQPTPYGPFRSPARVEEAIRRLSDLLQLRTSADTVPLYDGDQRELFSVPRTPRCLRGQLGLCLAPCAGRVSFGAYRERVEAARRFLLGHEGDLLADLRARMKEASALLEFERASVYRDRLVELEALSESLGRLRESLDKLTFVYAVPGDEGEDRLYFVRAGRVLATMPRCRGPRQIEQAQAFARELLQPSLPPSSGDEMDEIRVVASWFRARPTELGRTMKPDAFLADPRRWPEASTRARKNRIPMPHPALPRRDR